MFGQYGFEVVFRSQQWALVDNACREFVFLKQFFVVSEPDAMRLFRAVMGSAQQLVLNEVGVVVEVGLKGGDLSRSKRDHSMANHK